MQKCKDANQYQSVDSAKVSKTWFVGTWGSSIMHMIFAWVTYTALRYHGTAIVWASAWLYVDSSMCLNNTDSCLWCALSKGVLHAWWWLWLHNECLRGLNWSTVYYVKSISWDQLEGYYYSIYIQASKRGILIQSWKKIELCKKDVRSIREGLFLLFFECMCCQIVSP